MIASLPSPTFRRLFPPQRWRSRRGLSLIAWSLVAVLAWLAGLLLTALWVDLLAHRGELRARASQSELLHDLLAGTRFELPPALEAPEIVLTNSGLLPTIFRAYPRPWARWALAVGRRWPVVQSNAGAMLAVLSGVLLAGTVHLLAVSHVRVLAAREGMEAAIALRRSIHRQAMRLGPSDLDGAEQRTAVELFVDVASEAHSQLTRWLSHVIRVPVQGLCLLVLLLMVDWRLSLQCLIPLAAVGWVVHDERRRAEAIRQRAESEAELELRPLASGLRKTRLVRAYGMEEFEHDRFQKHLERYSEEALRGRVGETWALRTSRMFSLLLVVLIAFLVGGRALSELAPLPPGGVWLIAGGLVGLWSVAKGLLELQAARQQAIVAADRVYRYLAAVPEVSQAVGAKFLNPVSQTVILEAVTYRRQDRTLLERVDLRIPARTKTALVSSDPLAARAIAYMLPRFIEPQSGRILFDSEDIAWATLESLRAEAIFVGAEDPCFTGTVLENLTCGESRFSLQEAIEACKLVHAHKFITALPSGYETLLGEHGEQLRPGDAFRLGLARAVLRNPALLIIEEPSVRLDEDTKALIDDAYQRILPQRTVFFLPARLSTIRLCDQVVYLEGGRVAGFGPQAELVRTCEGYRHWEYIHFSSLARQSF